MSVLRPFSARLLLQESTCRAVTRQLRTVSDDAVREGDIVLLKNVKNRISQPVLTPVLVAGKKLKVQYDSIAHDDIVGKQVAQDLVVSRKKAQYRIHRPTLGEYTDNSARIVTPIYSQDASLIVSLLDLHPSVPGTSNEKLEIFEAGTGHGALTMFLSRAIHGANTAPPKVPADEHDDADTLEQYKAWLSSRRAIVHTLDISERHSMHARRVVRNFRNGMYFSNIDFHVGTIEDYLTPRLAREGPFLDHAILDLPNTHLNMDIVSKALKPNGTLITFCPSITQVATSLDLAKDEKLPLFLDSVVEIGGSVGVGGREWDVRRVQVRAQEAHPQVLAIEDSENTENTSTEGVDVDEERIPSVESQAEEPRWEMVCRPRVGTRVVGGGFVGVWRKKV